MFVYRIYKLDDRGKAAFPEDMPVDIGPAEAIAHARAAAVNCVIELWRGSILLMTFRLPEAPPT